MTVWFVSLLLNEKNAFGFCYQRGIIGVDWDFEDEWDALGFANIPKEILTPESLLKKLATAPLAMKKGDFVWTRNWEKDGGDDRFYLGKIPPYRKNESPWERCGHGSQHEEREEYASAGILYALSCPLHEVRNSDLGKNDGGLFFRWQKEFRSSVCNSAMTKRSCNAPKEPGKKSRSKSRRKNAEIRRLPGISRAARNFSAPSVYVGYNALAANSFNHT